MIFQIFSWTLDYVWVVIFTFLWQSILLRVLYKKSKISVSTFTTLKKTTTTSTITNKNIQTFIKGHLNSPNQKRKPTLQNLLTFKYGTLTSLISCTDPLNLDYIRSLTPTTCGGVHIGSKTFSKENVKPLVYNDLKVILTVRYFHVESTVPLNTYCFETDTLIFPRITLLLPFYRLP